MSKMSDAMNLGTRALALGFDRQRRGALRSTLVPLRAVMDSADARASAHLSRTWARWLNGNPSKLMEPMRSRALRKARRAER